MCLGIALFFLTAMTNEIDGKIKAGYIIILLVLISVTLNYVMISYKGVLAIKQYLSQRKSKRQVNIISVNEQTKFNTIVENEIKKTKSKTSPLKSSMKDKVLPPLKNTRTIRGNHPQIVNSRKDDNGEDELLKSSTSKLYSASIFNQA